MELEFRTFDPSQIETRVRDRAQGIIEIRSNVVDVVDSYDTVFPPGVWDEAVKRQGFLPYYHLDHDVNKQIGRADATAQRRDANGYWQHSTVRLNLAKPAAVEHLSDIEGHFRDFYSHGFASDHRFDRFEQRDGRNVRVIGRLRFWPDISSVEVPGGEGTGTLAVRSSALLLPQTAMAPRTAEHIAFVALDDSYTEVRSAQMHEEGKPYGVEYGHREGIGWVESALHYPVQSWTVTEARTHALAHGAGEFTPAAGHGENAQTLTLQAAGMPFDLGTLLAYRAVAEKTDAPKSPPKGYPSETSKYADPTNYKYPIDTDARIHAAVAYYNHSGQQSAGGYSEEEWASIGRKIVAAANSAFGGGYKLDNGAIKAPSSSDGESMRRSAEVEREQQEEAYAIETRMRFEALRLAGMGVEVRHAALSRASQSTMRQAHDAMARAVPGFCPQSPAEEAAEGEPSPGA